MTFENKPGENENQPVVEVLTERFTQGVDQAIQQDLQSLSTQLQSTYQPLQPNGFVTPALPNQGVCPGCGRCSTCGRGGYNTWPYQPYVPPVIWGGLPYPSTGGTTQPFTNGTIQGFNGPVNGL